ncbi:ninein-like protein [Brachionichthys hirsutus]|uniref:ninein-like protein n=1 Tax=Brachionichthys hirsutus TaxID=412623 RepID=UPI0036044959
MEGAEHSRYISQLKAEFDSCDTTQTGFLDRDELTELCQKLQLEAHRPLLLDTLLGQHTYARVNFEEFKEGFVAALSRSLDDGSYLQPVVPEEVKPKFVKGTKRYGRRSRPDREPDGAATCDSEDSPPLGGEAADSSPAGVRRAKLRRSTSLESVESLKSDEETGSQKENFQSKACDAGPRQDEAPLGAVDIVMEAQLDAEESDVRDFQMVLHGSAPISCSTPTQRVLHRSQAASAEPPARSAAPSLLMAAVGRRILSRLDDGSGCSSPEGVIALWAEEGIRNSRDILQTLDFSLEERLSLADLTLALDNELLVSGNGIHQAALISYKNELQHLQVGAEHACRQRDKVKADLELAEQRNLQLVREVDERHASTEAFNQSRVRDLERDYRDRAAALRAQLELENDAVLQQTEAERSSLQEELQLLRAQEARLQEELCSVTQENTRLGEELAAVTMKLAEEEASVNKLQSHVDQLLHDKFAILDPAASGPSHEERVSEIVEACEQRRRELQDRNDELNSELELLKSQRSNRKSRRAAGDAAALSWTASAETDGDESDMKSSSTPQVRKKLQPADKTALCSLDSVSGPAVSIQTELALEQLKQKHNQELQQLRIQLETQVNYYERSLELMRQSMEVERKDIGQAFKLEISDLEEQKAQVERQVKQLKETLDAVQLPNGGRGGGWSHERERRMQWERAELEQNFAREISNLVQKLSAEKDQLEAELKLKMDQEVMLVREEAEEQLSHIKQEHADGRRRLLHQLHQERQRLQDQRGLWEELQREERRTGICRTEEQRKGELGNLQAVSDGVLRDSVLRDREAVADDFSRLSKAFIRQQDQLRASEQTVSSLRSQLDGLQEDMRTRAECLSTVSTEREYLKTDRDKLIQDLKERAVAVDTLHLEPDGVSEELGRSRTRTSQLRANRDEEQEEEELRRLRQENRSYARLADQLSSQIVEMEEETSGLRDHLKEISFQLNDTADLVLELRGRLNSKSSEVDKLHRDIRRLRDGEPEPAGRVLLQLRVAEENFEQEKRRMAQQLVELEALVLALEEATDPAGPPRAQLEEVRSENGALQERLGVLQQEVQDLEEDVAKKRRKMEEMEGEHERSREEEERLHRENGRYREEVLDLSGRNLQLSNSNAELSARLRGDQESVRMLTERLSAISEQQQEAGSEVQRMRVAALQREAAWMQEKQQLEKEAASHKEQLGRLTALEAELSGATLKLRRLEEDERKRQGEADDRNNKAAALQRALTSLEAEADQLRSDLRAANQNKQEVTHLQGALQQAQNKLEELETSVKKLMREKQELHQALEEQEEQEEQGETHKLRVQNQELQHELAELQVRSVAAQELAQELAQEQQNLKTKLSEVELSRTRAQDQAVQAVQAQRLRELQELQEQVELLQARLLEEQRRSQQLEETLRLQAQQSSSQISMKQGQYETALSALQQRMEELETKLKGVRLVLQDTVQQLRDQLAKNAESGARLKDLHAENSQAMAALQVAEQRQKKAEKKNILLEDKVRVLNGLLREIAQVSLST